MRNSIQGQVKSQKRSNFHFLKPRHVSEVESHQQSNGAISFPVIGLQLSKIAFEGMTSSLGTMGEDKNIPLGVKNYRFGLKLCTLVT